MLKHQDQSAQSNYNSPNSSLLLAITKYWKKNYFSKAKSNQESNSEALFFET